MRASPVRRSCALAHGLAAALALRPASSYAADPTRPRRPAARRTSPATCRTCTTPTAGHRAGWPAAEPRLPRGARARRHRRPDLAADGAGRVADPDRGHPRPGRPGWNVGNPLRAGWNGTRGLSERISFTNRYGALLHGTVYRRSPAPATLHRPGAARSVPRRGDHRGLGAGKRGDVPLAGPGPRRARLRRPHLRRAGSGRRRDAPARTRPGTESNALPFCNPFATPQDGEAYGCPGTPAQQLSNFVVGTEDALSFFTSTPSKHYANPRSRARR
jgi:hypothetical protein